MRLTTQTRLATTLTIFVALPLALSCSSAKSHRSDRSVASETSQASGNATGASAPTGPAEASAPAPSEPVVTAANVGGNEVNAMVVHVGVRNFQAINQTMSSLTGVPTTNAAVAAAYAEQNSALPTETDVKSFVGSSQVAVFKLAVEYCNAMVNDKAKSAAIFGSINTAEVPSAVFSTSGKKAISEALISRFWGANLSTQPPLEQSSAVLTQLMTDLLAGKAMTNPAVTKGVLVAVCTTVLGSAPVTLY